MLDRKYMIISQFPDQSKLTQDVLGRVVGETNTSFVRSKSVDLNNSICSDVLNIGLS